MLAPVDSDERLERLERRLRELEDVVADLGAELAQRRRVRAPGEVPTLMSGAALAGGDPPRAVRTPIPERPSAGDAEEPLGAEQWIGQRGLLAAGVFLLILAAGFFLKLAFDRGWISPAMRCIGGAIFGAGLSALGWRLYQRQLRTYGAALIGTGAAIVYLAVWAAVRRYDLLPPTVGLGSLALVSVAVFAIGRVINVEALAASAAVGALLAPVTLGWSDNPDLLLLYSALLTGGLGWVSERRWRLTTFLIALCFFGVGLFGAGRAAPVAVLMYGVLGASAGFYVGLREAWSETRFVCFSGGWALLAAASGRMGDQHAVVAAGGMILAAPIWWRALTLDTIWPGRGDEDGEVSRAESFYFYVTAALLAWALREFAPAWFDRHPGVLPLPVAIPYLVAGFSRPRVPFALVGSTALMIAAMRAWDGYPAVWSLLGLAMLWASLDHVQDRRDGRWYALLGLGLAWLLMVDALTRRGQGAAFYDPWALALWGGIGVLAFLAAGLWRRDVPAATPMSRSPWERANQPVTAHMHAVMWVAAGALLLLGVSGELARFFALSDLPRATARLAGRLSVSAWWAVFAATLVGLGFQRDQKRVREAGLFVAGVAVVKVLLYDTSQLEALYRVASVFTLGLASLAVAYLYHRHAKGLAG